jgi:hypothetical protein
VLRCTGPSSAGIRGKPAGGPAGATEGSPKQKTAELAQLIEGIELDPYEAELRGIRKELTNSKAKAQILAHPLMRSDNPAITNKADKLAQEADEVASI